MSKIKKLLLSAAGVFAALGLVTPAFAVSQDTTQHGDLLIGDMYFANSVGGWETDIQVVNSSTTHSVVAKLVFRSGVFSEELLDVFLYLSPGDIWNGTVIDNGGTRQLTSEDDSIQKPNSTTFASAGDPATFSLQAPSSAAMTIGGDTSALGYFELIESRAFTLAETGACSPSDSTVPVQKPTIVNCHDNAATSVTEAQTVDSLSGKVVLRNVGAGTSLALPLDAYKMFDNDVKLNVAQETTLTTATSTTTAQLESVMAKDNVVVPYKLTSDTGTIAVVTFPTWLYVSQSGSSRTYSSRISSYAPFNSSPGVEVTYTVRDTEENISTSTAQNFSPFTPITQSLPNEVNLIDLTTPVGGFATMGWMDIDFEDDVTETYTGAPALTSIISFTVENDASGNPALRADWLRAAHYKTGVADTDVMTP